MFTGGAARKERKESGLTLVEVAERMGYSSMYLSDLERGKRTWNEELLQKFRAALRST